jgi:collagen type VII alpha
MPMPLNIRRDPLCDWDNYNPFLEQDELGVAYVHDRPVKAKLGPGHWNDLDYFIDMTTAGGSGSAGADGASAFEIAVANGFVGTAQQWLLSLVGAQGPKGDAGDDGVNGLDGAAGSTGPQGPQGIQGQTGTAGTTGQTGSTGPTGPTGLTGAKGDKGDTGDTGPQGPQGIQGAQGVQGTAGTNGTNGSDANITAAWPIGSIFMSVLSTTPATLLGFGTWAAFGAGKCLIGQNANDTDFDVAEETGGAKTNTPAGTNSAPTFTGSALGTHSHGTGTIAVSSHSGTAVADHAAHTHSVTSNVAVADHAAHTHAVTSNVSVADHASHTHTYTDVPNHTHTIQMQGSATPATTGTHICNSTSTGGTSRASVSPDATNNPTGGVATGTTAGPSAALSHTVTNNAVTSGNPSATLSHTVTNNAVTSGNPSATLSHSVTQPSDHTLSGSTAAVSAGTPAGTVSAPAFTGTPMSVVQPYIVVYMWKRTA